MANNAVLIYQGKALPRLDVLTDGETVWLSIDQMAMLFGRDNSVIGKHVKSVFSDGELELMDNRQILPKIRGAGRPTAIYSLDVVISVGYRVKSVEGVRFRQWATKCLREIMLGKLRRELSNERIERRLDSVEGRLTQVESGLTMIVDRLNEEPEPFYSDDRQMIGFGAEQTNR